MTGSSQRAAIITGGSGGIGRAAALRPADDGVHVLIHYCHNAETAQETADAVVGSGGNAAVFGGDVADEAQMQAMVAAATEEFGGIDVVVNTAGIMPLAPIAEMEPETFFPRPS